MEYVKLGNTAQALNVKLIGEDIAFLEKMYVPHKIVRAIDKNPPQGAMFHNEKK